MSLLGRVSAELARLGVPHALIGAAALAIHGVSRSTHDLDLLATNPACLDPREWSALSEDGIAVEVRKGDFDDPLAGVIRFTAPEERPVDLVVGKARWQTSALARAERHGLIDVELPVLRASDLILLKLFAGGPQDAWDVAQLLATPDGARLRGEVEEYLSGLPAASAALWRQTRGEDLSAPRTE